MPSHKPTGVPIQGHRPQDAQDKGFQPRVRCLPVEVGGRVDEHHVGWNERGTFRQQVRNYTTKPINVEVRRNFGGHIDFRSLLEPKLYDFQTVEFTTRVAAGAKKDLRYEIILHQGRNAKQNNVTLETAEIK